MTASGEGGREPPGSATGDGPDGEALPATSRSAPASASPYAPPSSAVPAAPALALVSTATPAERPSATGPALGIGVVPPDATPGELRQIVWTLAWPAVIEFTLVTLIGVVNMVMVGRVGAAAVAAIGICNQPIFLAQAVFQALSVGSTAIVARHIGAGENPRASEAARQSVVLTALVGVLASLPFMVWTEPIVRWMGAEPEVIPLANAYMRIVGGGTLFTVMGIVIAAILRGAGDTRTPMRVNGIANVVNVVVGFVLIFGYLGFPPLGVVGAACGALAARVVSTFLFLLTLYSGRTRLLVTIRQSHRLTRATVGRILHVGFPAAVEQFVMRGGQVFFARIIASLGTFAYAAHQITVNAESLAFMPAQALGVASTTLVGQNLGARQPETAERSVRETLRIALTILGVVGGIVLVFTTPILRMYTNEAEVIGMARFNMRLFALALPGMGVYFVLVGGLRGAGDTRWPLYVSVAGIWCIRLVFANLLAIRLGLGLPGAWVAMVLDHWSRAAICHIRFASGRWKQARV